MLRVDILTGNCLERLKELTSNSVHCVVTSPPYWGLRDYSTEPVVWTAAMGRRDCEHRWIRGAECPTKIGKQGYTDEIKHPALADTFATAKPEPGMICAYEDCRAWYGDLGMEPLHDCLAWARDETPCSICFVCHMRIIFAEVRRILRPDGILWLNLGDTYARQAGSDVISRASGINTGQQTVLDMGGIPKKAHKPPRGLKSKDLVGIPWRTAMALQSDGWYHRRDIVWHKPNAMPESVQDRPTNAHEFVFLMSKSESYYYDKYAIEEDAVTPSDSTARQSFGSDQKLDGGVKAHTNRHGKADRDERNSRRNKRDVWTVPTKPYPEAHFATFPTGLIDPCIQAGVSQRGCCPDCQSPWTRVVLRESGESNHAEADRQRSRNPMSGGVEAVTLGKTGSIKTQSLGWKPSCDCYGVDIIEHPPRKPKQKRSESDEDFILRLDEWENALGEWMDRWNTLSNIYDGLDVEPCVVLDPFFGAGTTGLVATRFNANAVGIELNPEYAKQARDRIFAENPLFVQVEVIDAKEKDV